jgi:dipeptidyl aminopeptidase/acylaminoacyl peptidase
MSRPWQFLAALLVATAAVAARAESILPSPTAVPRFITASARAIDDWPCFSPDGKSVLFSRSISGGRTWELWIVAAAGGEARKFTRERLPVSATRGNWSARNQLIAFAGISPDGRGSLWIVGPDGTNPHEVAVSGLSDRVAYPSWYPSGDRLAVLDARELVIKRVDLKEGTAVTITRHEQVLTGMPSVSADGQWVAFAGQKNAGQSYDQTQNSIWLVSGDGGVSRPLEGMPNQGRAPRWSPDGKRLAFESNRGSLRGLYAAFVINGDGSGLKQVTDYDFNANHPNWSPEGSRLALSLEVQCSRTPGVSRSSISPRASEGAGVSPSRRRSTGRRWCGLLDFVLDDEAAA